jgi:23S rRNA pseudouridine955/2504/2580 synthase
MHLHARRLVIALPDGGTLDVKADPPAHFMETLAVLGFDPREADLAEPEPVRAPVKKARKTSSATSGNRRGERRSRQK